jgi:superfamily II DNA or RNA helicase
MKMNSNQLKDEIQSNGVDLAVKYPFIVMEMATGVGKSLTFIKTMEKLGGFWNIVVAETNHIKNWEDEFKKHNKEPLLEKVRFFCYASLHKFIDDENYCFDEFHNGLLSDIRLEAISRAYESKMKRFVGLSATLSRKQKENLNEIIPNVYYHKITMSHAIDKEILPEPKVYAVGIELEKTKKSQLFRFSKDKSKVCTQQEWYDLHSNRVEYLKQVFFSKRTQWEKNKWLRAGSIRKEFLSDIKTPYAKELLVKLQDKRLICFTYSISQSEILSNGNSIHSKISAELRADMISDFNEGKIDKLFTTKMLRESMNLTNIEVGVMVQLDNNMKSFIQSCGRVLRAKHPEYYILYVKGTQDMTYLTNALEGFDEKYITWLNFDELK